MTLAEYFKNFFSHDLKAGLITAIVALPLAIAFAIASGVEPVMGIHTAIIAGILAAIFGGSTFSVTGPTGAMVVLVLSTVQKFGVEGLMLAGFLSGVFLLFFSFLRLGLVLKFIPLPIVSGFTAGIGVLIFLGQLGNFLGIPMPPAEHSWEIIVQIIPELTSANKAAVFIALTTIFILVFLPKCLFRFRYLKNIPASVLALVVSSSLMIFCELKIPVVGIIPTSLPQFHFFSISFSLLIQVLPAAFTIALLGAIESLLCAMVSDSMTNTKHKSNRELLGQGIANIVLPFFGGIPATAAIARTAVNIREGAKTRMSVVYHSLFLLIVLLFLGHLGVYIPKAFLSGVLMVVAIRMINIKEWKTIFTLSKTDAIVYMSSFLLTIITDLVMAIQMSMLLAMFLLFLRMIESAHISGLDGYEADEEIRALMDQDETLKEQLGVFTIGGPFFFGVMNFFDHKVGEHLHSNRPIIILRMKHVPFIDSTAVIRLKEFIHERQKKNSLVITSSLSPEVEKVLDKDEEFQKLLPSEYRFARTREALEFAKKQLQNKIHQARATNK